MRKLKLEIDALRVESFRTSNEAPRRGTVRGRGEPEAGDGAAFCSIAEDVVMAPAKTLPPAESCDTCARTCETMCSCITLPCATCACPQV
jgi:hypothetical protein